MIDELREKIDLWKKSTTDTALMSVLHDVLKQIDVAIYEMDHQEAESPWHRVEEPPKEDGKYVAINVKTKWWYEANYENGNWKAVDLFGQRWVVIHPTHWMPIEPPKEEA